MNRLFNKEKIDAMTKASTHAGMLRAAGLIPVGFWFTKKPERPAWDTRPIPPDPEGLLWPGDLVDLSWSAEERAKVVAFLKAGKKFCGYLGYSPCRLCENEHNGTTELMSETYVWPEGYAHYVEQHGVKPPQDFINHALGRK